MKHFRKSGKRLGDYLAQKKQSQRDFAHRVGSHQSIISRIVAGKIRPGIDLAYSIEAETNGSVKASSWAAKPIAQTDEAA
jgi:transcriptional regulator with XRE-family HTH domain